MPNHSGAEKLRLLLSLGHSAYSGIRHSAYAECGIVGAHTVCGWTKPEHPWGVQQKLMRHAHVSTTMDQYGNASALCQAQGQSAVRATPLEKVCQLTGPVQ